MSSEPSWPAPGVECICIRDAPWFRRPSREVAFLGALMGVDTVWEEYPGPSFMQQLKIKYTEILETDRAGHRLKLGFEEFPGLWYCACDFRPLEKIEDEETKDTTAPIDLMDVLDDYL